jgi:pimeloyl-ACP methyl ester carboxylesterase
VDDEQSQLGYVQTADGLRIAFHDFGRPATPSAPVILLAHATGFHGRCWSSLARHLRDSYHCVALDFRGHGLSELDPREPLSWSDFGVDLEAVLAGGPFDSTAVVHVVGHSMGGAAAVMVAASQRERVRSLWLFEPIIANFGSLGSNAPNPMADAARRRRSSFSSFEAAFENFASKPPLNQLEHETLWQYVQGGFELQADGSVELRCRPETEAAIFASASSNHVWQLIEDVTQPTKVVAGREREFGPGLFAPTLVDALPRATLEACDDLGHFGPLEDPRMMASDVRRWLEMPG